MAEVVETPAPEVAALATPAAPAPKATRFEIPVLTELKPAVEAPPVKASEATPPVATEGEKPPEVIKDPEAEKAAEARAARLRTNRLYKQNAELKAERDLYRQQAEKAQAPAAAATAMQGAPDPAKFTDITEYTKAVTDWAKAESAKELTAKQQQEQVTRRQTELTESWEKCAERGAAKYDDFEQVVGDLQPNSPWAIAVMQCENADDVAHYLGSNMAEAKRIIALDPMSQIREIGKLEAKLLATPPTPKPVSKAPAPITPVQGVAVPSEGLVDGMPYEKFLKVRNRQLGRTH